MYKPYSRTENQLHVWLSEILVLYHQAILASLSSYSNLGLPRPFLFLTQTKLKEPDGSKIVLGFTGSSGGLSSLEPGKREHQ